MAERDQDDHALDELFAAARRAAPEPGPELMARVLADAEAEQARFMAADMPARRARPGVAAGVFRALGGWPALAGLAAAGCAGLWIGISPPAALGETVAYLLGDTGGFLLADGGVFFDTGGEEG